MIKLTNVTKQYGALTAVRDLSLSVEDNQIIGLVGPNGAGKSTTMKIVTGYIVPTAGAVTVEGIDVIADPTSAQARIGYLPESNPLYPEMAVQDYLVFIGRMRGLRGTELQSRLEYAADKCGLRARMTQTIRTLSKGFKQRVGIAQAILHDPSILILDEPTSGLDPNQIIEIRDLIRELGENKTVILSTHILGEVEETCSRAVMIVGGRIAVDDTIDSLVGVRHVRFTCHGAGDDAAAAISDVAGVGTLTPVDATGDVRTWRVGPADGVDVAPGLFRLAVERGWEVRELAHERRSLEDVFKEASQEVGA